MNHCRRELCKTNWHVRRCSERDGRLGDHANMQLEGYEFNIEFKGEFSLSLVDHLRVNTFASCPYLPSKQHSTRAHSVI